MNTVQLEDYRAIRWCFQMEGDKVQADSLGRFTEDLPLLTHLLESAGRRC